MKPVPIFNLGRILPDGSTALTVLRSSPCRPEEDFYVCNAPTAIRSYPHPPKSPCNARETVAPQGRRLHYTAGFIHRRYDAGFWPDWHPVFEPVDDSDWSSGSGRLSAMKTAR